MKSRRRLLAAALLGIGLVGCGGSGKAPGSTSRSSDARAPGHAESYRDFDDNPVLTYGRAADAADRRAVTALVKRYYAAGAAGDGASACALTSRAFAQTIPEDYGQELGQAASSGVLALLRGARTCAAILSLLFEHYHDRLSAAVAVTGVRVDGEYGYALVGSATMPASVVEVGREGGVWRIDELLGRAVP